MANISDDLNVFHIGKRHKPYQRWEPIYIGTQSDPLYDERLTWEGKSDKMTQVLAILNDYFNSLNKNKNKNKKLCFEMN